MVKLKPWLNPQQVDLHLQNHSPDHHHHQNLKKQDRVQRGFKIKEEILKEKYKKLELFF